MGEEAKQEEPKVEEVKVEEKKTEEKKDEEQAAPPPPPPAEEEKKEEPKPPPPFVLYVDLHCVGCAKKIERSIMKIRGVEGVVLNMAKNEVTIKGIVEPQAVCNKIMKRTKRRAKVLSPLPEVEGDPIPNIVTSQISRPINTVELDVNMHCEACADQLKKKILKMRGVQTVTTELSIGKVSVTGTMDGNKLVEYVYRRTRKQAKIIPKPEPEPEPKPDKEEAKPTEEPPKPEEKGPDEPKPEEKKEDEKPATEENNNNNNNNNEDANAKQEDQRIEVVERMSEDENMKRMMYYYYQPLYVIERIPAPQLFSDENPNACCIS